MGSHNVTCHLAAVTFLPLPQPNLVLDLATLEGCKAGLWRRTSLTVCDEMWHESSGSIIRVTADICLWVCVDLHHPQRHRNIITDHLQLPAYITSISIIIAINCLIKILKQLLRSASSNQLLVSPYQSVEGHFQSLHHSFRTHCHPTSKHPLLYLPFVNVLKHFFSPVFSWHCPLITLRPCWSMQ